MFSLGPALAENGVLDYTEDGAKKLYYKATAPLAFDSTYDLYAENLTTFLQNLDIQAAEYGWEGILNIPVNADDRDDLYMLTTNYGQITMAQVDAHVEIYLEAEGRDVQNSFQLFNCLRASLTKVAKRKLGLQRDKFHQGGLGVGAQL